MLPWPPRTQHGSSWYRSTSLSDDPHARSCMHCACLPGPRYWYLESYLVKGISNVLCLWGCTELLARHWRVSQLADGSRQTAFARFECIFIDHAQCCLASLLASKDFGNLKSQFCMKIHRNSCRRWLKRFPWRLCSILNIWSCRSQFMRRVRPENHR